MKRAFTLLELLVVIGIMGLLGTVSIGGYRSVTRGMEERSAVENADKFMRAAYQRAMIDRAPVIVFYWNETIKEEDDENPAIVVGKAIAVRRAGRISLASSPYLYDEFADLNLSFETNNVDGVGVYLYNMSDIEGDAPKRSIVSESVYLKEVGQEAFLPDDDDDSNDDSNKVQIPISDISISMYGFKTLDGSADEWRNGDAYGFEFQTLTLPHNYIFGSEFSRTMSNPITGEKKVCYSVSNIYGDKRIQISALRPNTQGALTAVSVDQTEDPSRGEAN